MCEKMVNLWANLLCWSPEKANIESFHYYCVSCVSAVEIYVNPVIVYTCHCSFSSLN